MSGSQKSKPGSVRVLLVESDPSKGRSRPATLRLERKPQILFTFADSLRTALDRLGEEPVDAVVLDLSLADGQGLAAFDKVQAAAPSTPIVIWSDGVDDEVTREALERGAHDILEKKNAQPEMLARVIHQAIERQQWEKELSKAKDRADVATRLKSRFLGNMSHEIRNPMNAILGFTEILKEDLKGNREALRYLTIVHQSGRHLLSLINGILELAKIESGEIEVTEVTYSPRHMVADIEALMKTRSSEKGLNCSVHCDASVPDSVVADSARIRQIVISLVDNAIKFTETGSVILNLKAIEDKDGRTTLEFRVRDTGIGIPRERLEEIFTPFHQLHTSDTRRYGGTGLGLTISRRLTELLGGKLSVRSEEEVGTVVTLSVPCEQAATTEPERVAEPDAPGETAPPESGTLLGDVLVVEDALANQVMIKTILQNAGATVEIAENGAMGLEKAAARPFDLVVMDIIMPVMDGFQALTEIRRLGLTMPVIALTANAMPGDRELCLDAGFTAYLSKPVNRAALIETVGRLLDASREKTESPDTTQAEAESK